MKNKYFFLISTILVLFSLVYVNATLTIPVTATAYSTNITLTADNSSFPYIVNCSFYAMSTSTANSSWTLLTTGTNASDNPPNINKTFNTAFLEDSNDYIFNATCRNYTNSVSSTTVTAVIIDNTAPSTPSSLKPSTQTIVSSAETTSLSATVGDSSTISCSYIIAKGGTTSGSDYVTGTGTYSGSNCSFTKEFSDLTSNGDWYWYVTASDGTNTTSSAQIILQVNIPASGGNLDVAQQNEQNQGTVTTTTTSGSDNNSLIAIILIIIVIVGVILYNAH